MIMILIRDIAHTLHDDCNLWRDVVIVGLIVCFFIRGRSHTAGASRFGQGTVYHRWARSLAFEKLAKQYCRTVVAAAS